MNKLALEQAIKQHICYGAKVEVLNHYSDYVGLPYSDANGYYMLAGNIHMTYNGGSTGKSIKEFRFCLRPPSDLTKEIEHKGEKFVPLIYLYNISNRHNYNKELNFEWVKSWGAGDILKVYHHTKGEYTEFIYHDLAFRKDVHYEKGSYRFGMDLPHAISCVSKIENQYKLHQLLFEWHFDVFGLIQKGLAVDINTIENET